MLIFKVAAVALVDGEYDRFLIPPRVVIAVDECAAKCQLAAELGYFDSSVVIVSRRVAFSDVLEFDDKGSLVFTSGGLTISGYLTATGTCAANSASISSADYALRIG